MGADFSATIERKVVDDDLYVVDGDGDEHNLDPSERPGDAWSVVELFELCGRSGAYADYMRGGDPEGPEPPEVQIEAQFPNLSPLVRWRFDPSRRDMSQHDPPYWIRLYSAREFLDRVRDATIPHPDDLNDVIEMLIAICQLYGKDDEHRVCLWYGP